MHITIDTGGEDIILTQDNARVYRFRRHQGVDHAYYETEFKQMYIFNCEHLLTTMEQQGATLILADYPSPEDEDAYIRFETSTIDDELDSL